MDPNLSEEESESEDEEYIPGEESSESSEGEDEDYLEEGDKKPTNSKKRKAVDNICEDQPASKEVKLDDLDEKARKAKAYELLLAEENTNKTKPDSISAPNPTPTVTNRPVPAKAPSTSMNKVLSMLTSQKKTSVLSQSQNDWMTYVNREGIEEDLNIHNRGKDGFLERSAFQQRTDLRQFEIEKTMRWKNRPK